MMGVERDYQGGRCQGVVISTGCCDFIRVGEFIRSGALCYTCYIVLHLSYCDTLVTSPKWIMSHNSQTKILSAPALPYCIRVLTASESQQQMRVLLATQLNTPNTLIKRSARGRCLLDQPAFLSCLNLSSFLSVLDSGARPSCSSKPTDCLLDQPSFLMKHPGQLWIG